MAVALAITIVAWAHLKLAGIALRPIGKMMVPIESHGEVRQPPPQGANG
jgi:uncharacterized membrane protein YccF (DUF307 family)